MKQSKTKRPVDKSVTHRRRYLDFSAIDNTALVYAESVIKRYLPNGKTIGNEFVCINPRRADSGIGSFKFNLANGFWADFACGSKGKGVISYITYVTGRKPHSIALELARILGMEVYHD